MSKKLSSIMAIASMFGAMSGMPMPSLGRGREQKTPVLPQLKHTGDIPKGCHIEQAEFLFTSDTIPKYTITVTADIVGATKKSILKEKNRIEKALKAYIEEVHPLSLTKIDGFKILVVSDTPLQPMDSDIKPPIHEMP